MKAENIALDNSSQRKVVEEVGEGLPDLGITILTKALIVESIHLGDLLGFVVASQNGDSLRMSDFVADQESDGLD